MVWLMWLVFRVVWLVSGLLGGVIFLFSWKIKLCVLLLVCGLKSLGMIICVGMV